MEVQFHSFLTSPLYGSKSAITQNSQDAASATPPFLILENKKLLIWNGLQRNNVHNFFLMRDCDVQNGWCHWSLCSKGVVRSMASNPVTKQKTIQTVNADYMGDFADSMSGFRFKADTCIKCNQYPISYPVLKYEPSTNPT